jgi:hypothetical protein
MKKEKKKEVLNWKKDMRIDEDALDVEWLEQAELATKWGEYYNELDDEVRRAEQNEKIVRSELILAINQDPLKYLGKDKKGVPIKPTDAKVEAAMRVQPEHQDAKERLIGALKARSDVDNAHKEISFTRKAALEQLGVLLAQNYFAGPKMPRDIRNERMKKENRDDTRSKANKRVRKMKRK